MTRIIAGAAGGRRLVTPPGRATRPTTDRAREGLFSTVAAMLGDLTGTRVLDLYAGTGAVGLEALSRGAVSVALVDRDPRAAHACRVNAAAVGLPGVVVAAVDVHGFLAAGNAGAPVDLAYVDPPYQLGDPAVRAVLSDLVSGGWLAAGAVVVVERSSRGAPWSWPAGIEADRVRRYGDATLWYGRAAGSGPGAAPPPGGSRAADS